MASKTIQYKGSVYVVANPPKATPKAKPAKAKK